MSQNLNPSADVQLCWNWQHAPHHCGLIRTQVVRDTEGNVLYVYQCRFCERPPSAKASDGTNVR